MQLQPQGNEFQVYFDEPDDIEESERRNLVAANTSSVPG
jgi:hypothetical protein